MKANLCALEENLASHNQDVSKCGSQKHMSVIDKLATSLNRRDEVPNQELARKIAAAGDKAAVRELVDNLSNENRGIPSDCIKTLYEIAALRPKLIAPYHRELGALLDNKNNRLVWGAMTALDAIAFEEPKGVYKMLAKIINIADTGSVITRDHAVGILIKLGSMKAYAPACLPLLLEQLMKAPNNQFPMYIERAEILFNERNQKAFEGIINRRLAELDRESARKRVGRILKRINRPASEKKKATRDSARA